LTIAIEENLFDAADVTGYEATTTEQPKTEAVPEIQAIAATPDPSQLLAVAVRKDFDIEKLQKLMDLYERWQIRQARAAYYDALAEFQSKIPRIPRRKLVSFTNSTGSKTEYYYAPLGDIDECIKETMQSCLLSKRWVIEDKGELITVTCHITHAMGHSEQAEMTGKADASGGKNAIQQRGSTIQYLQRYTLIGALGIATADDDIDARIGPDADDKITVEQAAHIRESLRETKGNEQSLLTFLKVSTIDDIPLAAYGKAIRAIADRAKAVKEREQTKQAQGKSE